MNANHKILDILIAEMGAEAILAICQERLAASKKVVSTPPPAVAAAPKAPIKILSKKPVVPKKDETAKNLAPQIEAAASSSSFVCPPCGKGDGEDHRLCIVNAFDCNVEAWESAVGLRPSSSAAAAAAVVAPEQPKSSKPIVVIKKAAPKKVSPPPAAVLPEPEAAPEVPKKAGRPKKVVADVPRCDARIYGEQLEMEGTKAPNGKPLHCFRPAQCERKGGVTLAISQDEEVRRLKDDETPHDDEGKFHLCKVCVNRWEAREEHADNWHGFFDDDGAPETSHFLNGAWYKKKMATVAAKTKEESD
jgi:hypothetical protein